MNSMRHVVSIHVKHSLHRANALKKSRLVQQTLKNYGQTDYDQKDFCVELKTKFTTNIVFVSLVRFHKVFIIKVPQIDTFCIEVVC